SGTAVRARRAMTVRESVRREAQMKKILLAAVIGPGALLSALSVRAAADNSPGNPLRVISPFPPGGSVDLVGRLVAARLTEALGQQVIVDNRTGASGTIGTELAARAALDGYT